MASLQKIRNHGPLLIVIIGLAMLAFILSDFLNNSTSIFRENPNKLGSIAGEVVHSNDFNAAQQFYEAYPYALVGLYGSEAQREALGAYMNTITELQQKAQEGNLDEEAAVELEKQWKEAWDGIKGLANEIKESTNFNQLLWNEFVTYYTFKPQAEKIGMDISYDEYERAMQVFGLPYGAPEHITKGIYLQQKYMALLRNTLAVNSLEAEFAFNSRQQAISAEYVMLPYDAIADSLVEVSEKDIKALYDQYKSQFRTEPMRRIEYTVINYEPSEADMIKEAEFMASIQEDFRTANDIEALLKSYSDAEYQDIKVFAIDAVPAEFAEFVANKEAKVGDCSEILLNEHVYSMARIMALDKKNVSLAIVRRVVDPSEPTKVDLEYEYRQLVREHATVEEFEQMAREKGLPLQYATVQELTQKIGGLQDCRKVVLKAFETAEGNACDDAIKCGDHIVIAAVVEANDEYYMPLDKVREGLRIMAANDAKAKYIEQEMNVNGLDEAAQVWGQSVQSVARMSLADNYPDPAVVGAAFAQGENAVSGLIKGDRGMYIVKTGARLDGAEEYTEEAAKNEKARLSQAIGTKFQQAIQELTNNVRVKINDLERF